LKWGLAPGATFVVKFFYMLLLHASFVPVALYVSMALVRFAQAQCMQRDEDMYYPPLDAFCNVRTMTLNEELGQISHIFSDKTGTLTCNVMNFRKASINGVSYGKGITEIGRAAWKLLNRPVPEDVLEAERLAAKRAVPHVAFYDPDFERDAQGGGGASAGQAQKIRDFYRFLAVCHEVVPERLEDGSIKMSGTWLSADFAVVAFFVNLFSLFIDVMVC
jgi:phospholipid-transporting ATPase